MSRDSRSGRRGAGAATGEPSPPERSPVKRRPFDPIRENVEAVAVAVVLALIIRHFSVEAFEIPTGSMAPTLYGIHSWLECPNCSTEFNVGLGSDWAGNLNVQYRKQSAYWGRCPDCKLPHHRAGVQPGASFVCPFDAKRWVGEAGDFNVSSCIEIGHVVCPICWLEYSEVLTERNRTGGHKILVDKFIYKMTPPRRWDVIVFQFNRETNYIKRLIGLPGEKVLIRGGDVHVNGHIERKFGRPRVQEVLWTKVADSDVAERGYQKVAAWKEVFPEGAGKPAGAWDWNKTEKRFSVNAGAAGPVKTAILRYQRPIRNYYPYNLLSQPGLMVNPEQDQAQVGDKKVAFTARPPRGAKGWLGAEIRDGEFNFQVRIPVGQPDAQHPATLQRLPVDPDPEHPRPDREPAAGQEALSATAPVALAPDRATRVEYENLDDRVALRLNGVEVLSLEYDSGGNGPRSARENGLYLLAGGGAECVVESIQVYRDVYYTEPDMAQFAVHGRDIALASDGQESEYFPCGDNSPSSSDGRYWGHVPERNLMGRALLVFWPLWPTNWQFKFIR